MHIDKEDYSYARAGVAVSSKPEGPFEYKGSTRPNGQMSRDMTLFKDDDGKAYLVYASEDNNTMQICLLSEDYLSPTKNFTRILIDQRREAPALFKHRGKYFLITSYCSGWSPNAALYSVADTVMGKWENRGNPCVGPGAENTFESQSRFVLSVRGKSNEFIFIADRWNKTDLPDSRYVWLPFHIKNEKIEIKWRIKNKEQLKFNSFSFRADFEADSKMRTTIRLFSRSRSCPGFSLPLSTSAKY